MTKSFSGLKCLVSGVKNKRPLSWVCVFLEDDLSRKRLLGLDDVFVPGATKGLEEAITAKLVKQTDSKSIKGLHEAGFFVNSDVYPTGNFILGDKSITFVYVAGEIADREKGEIQVEVNYSDIKNLMKR